MTERDFVHRVISNRRLGHGTFALRFEKRDMDFQPGQYLSVGVDGDLNLREYSIYSPTTEPWLEILVKEVEGGLVSRRLAKLVEGDKVRVEGPFGYFTSEEGPHLFIASGTGISPFHSMSQSLPNLDYTLIHGVRHDDERYDSECYPSARYIPCISQSERSDATVFRGRVTQWLREHTEVPTPGTHCFLSGNCDMIYEVYDILRERDIPSDRIKAEVYF